nr:discoidin domain-containing protein [Cytophagaceae bacterium]
QIDLGSRKNISKVVLNWEAASARSYNLEVSDDGITWTLVKANTNMAAGARIDTHSGLTAKGRYIRMYGTSRNTTFGYSIYEFKVDGEDAPGGPVANAGEDQTVNDADNNGSQTVTLNGSQTSLEAGTTATYSWKLGTTEIATGASASVSLPVGTHNITLTVTDSKGQVSSDVVIVKVTEFQAPNIALNKPVAVSSTESGFGNVAANATDGSLTTRWSSAYADPQNIRIDLQAAYSISRIQLNWEAASARDYRIETSLDGTTWALVSSRTNMAAGARIDNLTGLSAVGRYVRITGTARTTIYGYSLFEVQVYGTPSGDVNLPPTANAGADITVTDSDNNLSELIALNGAASSDADGTIASYAWAEAGNATLSSSLASPSFTLPVGSYRFLLTVTDDKGASSTDEVLVTVRARETCTLLTRFGVPASSALPTISSRQYSKVYVLGTGPNLGNVNSLAIQWELQYNGLWQFAFNTNNGVPAWYHNLGPLTAHTFNRSNPDCRITGSGIARLDGEYWVKMDGTNFVMVAKSGSHALYFTNSSTAPVGCNAVRSAEDNEVLQQAVSVAPSMAQSLEMVTVSLPDELAGADISLMNGSGSLVKQWTNVSSREINFQEKLTQGVYLIRVVKDGNVITKKLVVY